MTLAVSKAILFFKTVLPYIVKKLHFFCPKYLKMTPKICVPETPSFVDKATVVVAA